MRKERDELMDQIQRLQMNNDVIVPPLESEVKSGKKEKDLLDEMTSLYEIECKKNKNLSTRIKSLEELEKTYKKETVNTTKVLKTYQDGKKEMLNKVEAIEKDKEKYFTLYQKAEEEISAIEKEKKELMDMNNIQCTEINRLQHTIKKKVECICKIKHVKEIMEEDEVKYKKKIVDLEKKIEEKDEITEQLQECMLTKEQEGLKLITQSKKHTTCIEKYQHQIDELKTKLKEFRKDKKTLDEKVKDLEEKIQIQNLETCKLQETNVLNDTIIKNLKINLENGGVKEDVVVDKKCNAEVTNVVSKHCIRAREYFESVFDILEYEIHVALDMVDDVQYVKQKKLLYEFTTELGEIQATGYQLFRKTDDGLTCEEKAINWNVQCKKIMNKWNMLIENYEGKVLDIDDHDGSYCLQMHFEKTTYDENDEDESYSSWD